ncbi:methyltransferase [Planktothrix phage PaV-LD]|uniref:methyltransferase n=1 Tax=Planktothrix phage PaV-LD TaxID=994601 RepID=UPI000243C8A2|nr:methyltransferase [Planktothrix phage PaV-LD]ADZ31536.1 hypothetical protein PaVLD_ORF029L [Planktothrix phage PaV-LD]
MSNQSLYSISLENQDIIIKFNREMVNLELLTQFLEYLELESIRNRSQLTAEQITNLSQEVNQEVWDTFVACKELGRNYICIEKEKEYFDIACDRISQPREYSETELEIMELKQPEFKQLSLFDVA